MKNTFFQTVLLTTTLFVSTATLAMEAGGVGGHDESTLSGVNKTTRRPSLATDTTSHEQVQIWHPGGGFVNEPKVVPATKSEIEREVTRYFSSLTSVEEAEATLRDCENKLDKAVETPEHRGTQENVKDWNEKLVVCEDAHNMYKYAVSDREKRIDRLVTSLTEHNSQWLDWGMQHPEKITQLKKTIPQIRGIFKGGEGLVEKTTVGQPET